MFKYPWEEKAALVRVKTQMKHRLMQNPTMRIGITMAKICRSPTPAKKKRREEPGNNPPPPPLSLPAERRVPETDANTLDEMRPQELNNGSRGSDEEDNRTPPIREGGGEDMSLDEDRHGSITIDSENLVTPSTGDAANATDMETHFQKAMELIRGMEEGPTTSSESDASTPRQENNK